MNLKNWGFLLLLAVANAAPAVTTLDLAHALIEGMASANEELRLWFRDKDKVAVDYRILPPHLLPESRPVGWQHYYELLLTYRDPISKRIRRKTIATVCGEDLFERYGGDRRGVSDYVKVLALRSRSGALGLEGVLSDKKKKSRVPLTPEPFYGNLVPEALVRKHLPADAKDAQDPIEARESGYLAVVNWLNKMGVPGLKIKEVFVLDPAERAPDISPVAQVVDKVTLVGARGQEIVLNVVYRKSYNNLRLNENEAIAVFLKVLNFELEHNRYIREATEIDVKHGQGILHPLTANRITPHLPCVKSLTQLLGIPPQNYLQN